VYPPGIPILIQGERISQNTVDYLHFLKTQRAVITGMNDESLKNISILKGEDE
jgi:arginine/lysine/ornithine decarboxylase